MSILSDSRLVATLNDESSLLEQTFSETGDVPPVGQGESNTAYIARVDGATPAQQQAYRDSMNATLHRASDLAVKGAREANAAENNMLAKAGGAAVAGETETLSHIPSTAWGEETEYS